MRELTSPKLRCLNIVPVKKEMKAGDDKDFQLFERKYSLQIYAE